MAVNPTAIADAIVADLTAIGGLAPTATKKYIEPVFDIATDMPALAVWTEETEYTPIDTAGAFSRTHHMVVAWFVYDESINDHGFDDITVIVALDTVREQIVARVAAYSNGIPGVTQAGGTALCATLRTSTLTPHETSAGVALVTVNFDVDDWA